MEKIITKMKKLKENISQEHINHLQYGQLLGKMHYHLDYGLNEILADLKAGLRLSEQSSPKV